MIDDEQQLFLVRHGRTVLNAQDRLRGLADPALDEVGLAQAEAVAAALAGHDIAAVYSSPLQRAVTTAGVIAARFGVAAHADARFNDRDYGPWTGHERSEVVDLFGTVDAAPGVEATAVVLERALPALYAVRAEHPGRAIVVVSHDAVIRPLIEAIDPALHPAVPTGSFSELRWDGDRWRIESAGRMPKVAA